MRPSSTSTNSNLRELALLALMGALMFALQVAMASIPNVHLTALLIILTAIFFGWKCLFSVAVFVILEAFVWGFGLWWLCYWYLWPLLAIPAVLLRKNRSAFLWAVLAAIHGLTFGAFCSIPYLFIGGWELALSYWVSGLSFDLIHCGGNFVLTLVLFNPLYRVMDKLTRMFLLSYSAVEIVLDSTRYDSSFFPFNSFISIAQVVGALCVLGILIYYSVHAVKARGLRFYHFALWFGFLLTLGAAGASEYMVQRHGSWYLGCYAVMSLSCYLMVLLVYQMYLRCCAKRNKGV